MRETMAMLQEFNTASCIVRLLVAALLGGAIGIGRELQGRAAGLRTHILVCIGATTTVIAGLYTAYVLGFSNDPLRAGAQVISGIGFLGAGTILVRGGNHVVGLTTAAGLWTTAAIGLVIGVGFYPLALAATVVVVAATVLLGKMETDKRLRKRFRTYYLELSDLAYVQRIADLPFQSKMQFVEARSGQAGHIGLRLMVNHASDPERADALLKALRALSGVAFVIPDDDD